MMKERTHIFTYSAFYQHIFPASTTSSPLLSGSLSLSVQNRRKLQDCQYCHCTASKTSLYCGSEYKDGARPHLGLSFPGLLFNFHAVVFNFNTLQTWGGIQFGKSGELFNFPGKFKSTRKIKWKETRALARPRQHSHSPGTFSQPRLLREYFWQKSHGNYLAGRPCDCHHLYSRNGVCSWQAQFLFFSLPLFSLPLFSLPFGYLAEKGDQRGEGRYIRGLLFMMSALRGGTFKSRHSKQPQ